MLAKFSVQFGADLLDRHPVEIERSRQPDMRDIREGFPATPSVSRAHEPVRYAIHPWIATVTQG